MLITSELGADYKSVLLVIALLSYNLSVATFLAGLGGIRAVINPYQLYITL